MAAPTAPWVRSGPGTTVVIGNPTACACAACFAPDAKLLFSGVPVFAGSEGLGASAGRLGMRGGPPGGRPTRLIGRDRFYRAVHHAVTPQSSREPRSNLAFHGGGIDPAFPGSDLSRQKR